MNSLDIEDSDSLLDYLRLTGRISQGEKCAVEKLSLGVSNKTQLLTRESGEQWVIKQSLHKLRVRQDWFSSRERIQIEYEGLKWLSKTLMPGNVPEPVFFDNANFILCMRAVPRPHDNLKLLILKREIDIILFKKLGEMLGVIHKEGKRSEETRTLFANRTFFTDLRIEPFYEFTGKRIPGLNDFFHELITQTLKVQETIVHGDFSPKNILVRNGNVVLLDYEVMHYGDPAFDIGFFLCQMLSFTNHLPDVKEGLINASLAFWSSYSTTVERISDVTEERAVRHTIGCLLARIKGRSPVDFLTDEEQQRQINISGKLAGMLILKVPELIETFRMELK